MIEQAIYALVIAAIGDSTTVGSIGSSTGQEVLAPYTDHLQEDDWEVHNFGVRGERSEQILARFHEVEALMPDIVIIWVGQNDLTIHRTAASVIKNVRVMVQRAKKGGIRPIVMTVPVFPYAPPQVKSEIRIYNALLERLALEKQIDYVVIGKIGSDDGIHPDALTYKNIAKDVRETILESDN